MKGSKLVQIALGIITSIGGFLDAGAIATAAQAGAGYRYQLIWAFLLGTLCVIFLVEMSGRLAAVSHRPLPAAVRERFGINYSLIPLLAGLVVDLLVLASELGGACLALQLVTGIHFRWWALPLALLVWLVLWNATFSIIENGVAILGLITLAFVAAAFHLGPDPVEVLRGCVPSIPDHHKTQYWFLSVSIIGALISPYLFNFYSSGAIEEEWDQSYVPINRLIAALGMAFGCVVAVGVLVVAALVFQPRGVKVDVYEQAAMILSTPWGQAGYYLFAASLFIACFGAALEVSLDSSYLLSQTLGWNWGESPKPIEATRFSAVYTLFLIPGTLLVAAGLDPLKLTLFSMALTAVILPLIVFPFLVLMNDKRYLGEFTNGRFSNIVVFLIIALAFIVAIVAIPLEIAGG